MPEENSGGRDLPVKEFGERTLNAGRLYSLLRGEAGIEDPWHIMALSLCSFEQMHPKDGWEYMLTNRKDIEDVGRLFERSNSQEEFREGLLALKEQDLRGRLGI
ncbi:MAG: hypothetical protein WA982_13340 [Rubrobacteraceae bacterium]